MFVSLTPMQLPYQTKPSEYIRLRARDISAIWPDRSEWFDPRGHPSMNPVEMHELGIGEPEWVDSTAVRTTLGVIYYVQETPEQVEFYVRSQEDPSWGFTT